MAPILYLIAESEKTSLSGCAASIMRACAARDITVERLVSSDFSLEDAVRLQPAAPSLLYRVSTRPKAQLLESTLVLRHPGQFTTIYAPKTVPLPTRSLTEMNEQIMAGLRVIPTMLLDNAWQQYDEARLTAEMAGLGGFPVIVKRLGLSHGQGVQKVHNPAELRALLQDTDFATASAIARRYLADYRHYRLIVVAGEVVAAIEYHVPADDFRTNAAEPVVSAVAVESLSEEMRQMAIESVDLRASILGGVDILVDQADGQAYLAEANVPCYFVRAEEPTGIDIGGLLVDALLAKQQKELA
jgi:hypothetical protein